MVIKIELVLDDKIWLDHVTRIKVKNIVKKALTGIMSLLGINITKYAAKTIELSIVLTGDNTIRDYNRNYRDNDKPTNVLSFPIYEKEFIKELKCNDYLLIGDVVLSIDTILKESKEQNKPFLNHLTHLIVHSILHLFGFDHINIQEAKDMETMEIKVLNDFGIDNPYE